MFLHILIVTSIIGKWVHGLVPDNGIPKLPAFSPIIYSPIMPSQIQQITVKNLIKDIEGNKFNEIYFKENNHIVYAIEKTDNEDTDITNTPNYVYVSNISPFITTKIVDVSLKHDVNPVFVDSVISQNNGAPNIFSFVPFAIYAYIFISIVNGIRNRFGGAGNRVSNKKGGFPSSTSSFQFPGFSEETKIENTRPNITLADWAGSKEVLFECSEIISYLKDSTNYEKVGAMIPKGILMEGTPGTGKTLLAKAIAHDADANFIEASGSEFVEMYVGLGALRVRKLFEDARQNRPCVIFIDEIDAVGRQRAQSGMGGSGNDEKDQTLNQLLAEMDGFKDNEGIMVLAATNRRDILDAALLRPGRFDRIIRIPLPDTRSREQIFKLYLKDKTLSPDVNVTDLARFTSGYSGAEIKNVINEAAIYTARQNETVITKKSVFEALEKAIIGIKKVIDDRSEETKRRVAIHELGHAFMVNEFPTYFDLKKISIQASYSGVGGFTMFNEKEDIAEGGLYTKDFLMKRLMISLGGKAAETIFYGDDFVSLGATMDLNTANQLAVDMIERYGMGERLKLFYRRQSSSFINGVSEKTQALIDIESRELVETAYNMTMEVLLRRKNQIDTMIHVLTDKITMDENDFSTHSA